MIRVEVVLRALWKALRREQKSLMEFPANNLYYVAVAFLVALDPIVMLFIGVIVGVVLFFPLSSDPLRRIPPSRFQLWPLSDTERRLVRFISPWLNPMTWIVAAFALWRGVSLGLGLLVAAVFLIGFLSPSLKFQGKGTASALFPKLPTQLGQLIRKNLRQLLCTLDFYCALFVGGAALGYRLGGLLPPDAFLPGTLLVTLAISTCAQTLFGLDGRAGISRYRLLPLRGWQILLAKDIAYITISVALTLSLAPVAGLAAALAALATARKPAIHENRAQIRWRLQAGTNFGNAITQILAVIGAATTVHLYSPLLLIPVTAIWLASLWWGGREIERKLRA